MTCIVGLEHDGKVFMGGDSSSASGWTVRSTAIEKVFQRGPFLIGFTSSFRMGQILRYSIDFPPSKVYDEKYMVERFVESVRAKFKELGFSKIQNNEEEGGIFLVGVAGKIWQVFGDFQVNRCDDGMASVGSGSDFALGALKALEGELPEERIFNALRISSYFCGAVKPPFSFFEQ